MFHGTGDSGQPVLSVGAVKLLAAVREGQLQHAPECAFLANHAIIAARGDYLVAPPAWSHLGRKHIHCAGLAEHRAGDVVCKGQLGLRIMGEARFEELLTYLHSVDIERIDSEAGGHPFCGHHLRFVGDVADEPAGAVSGARTVHYPSGEDGCVCGRYPAGSLPGRIVEGVCPLPRCSVTLAGDYQCQQRNSCKTFEKYAVYHICIV